MLQQTQQNAVSLVRDLLARHDSDSRYQSPERLARVASLYFPLLAIVMDAFPKLYKGGETGTAWGTFNQYGDGASASASANGGNGAKAASESTALAKRLAVLSGTGTIQGANVRMRVVFFFN